MKVEIKAREGVWIQLQAENGQSHGFKGSCRAGSSKWQTHLPDAFLRRAGQLHLTVPGLTDQERSALASQVDNYLAQVHSQLFPMPVGQLPLPSGAERIPAGIASQGISLILKRHDGRDIVICQETGGHTRTTAISEIPLGLPAEERCELLAERLGIPAGPKRAGAMWITLGYGIGQGHSPFSRKEQEAEALSRDSGAHVSTLSLEVKGNRLTLLLCHGEGVSLCLNVLRGNVARLSPGAEHQVKEATLKGDLGPEDMSAIVAALGRLDAPSFRKAAAPLRRWGQVTIQRNTLGQFSAPH